MVNRLAIVSKVIIRSKYTPRLMLLNQHKNSLHLLLPRDAHLVPSNIERNGVAQCGLQTGGYIIRNI